MMRSLKEEREGLIAESERRASLASDRGRDLAETQERRRDDSAAIASAHEEIASLKCAHSDLAATLSAAHEEIASLKRLRNENVGALKLAAEEAASLKRQIVDLRETMREREAQLFDVRCARDFMGKAIGELKVDLATCRAAAVLRAQTMDDVASSVAMAIHQSLIDHVARIGERPAGAGFGGPLTAMTVSPFAKGLSEVTIVVYGFDLNGAVRRGFDNSLGNRQVGRQAVRTGL